MIAGKKSVGSMTVLIVLGIIALYAGGGWVALLIPAALLVWYRGAPKSLTGRN